ncbi:globin [Thiohalophilus thiocyanatoxydans]|uniref:Hemoglobin-like flavoprotein n=1 Tax=Thiohalophilus thiocyanatoxydans TaxID=381308 RepID=A0A4V3H3K4_9GAMM|nr:globin [Thiohalophilus thiocyanatoxydans]TDX99644.1 hemoglobin-like flavoprotein [Thiohalophilus thiocyanatoxydans]
MSAGNTASGDSYDDLHQSYGRCLHNGGFIERFYDVFLESHPEVKNAFANTDFNRQRRLLRRTLSNSIMFAAGSEIVKREVDKMAEIHSRHGHAPVQPHLYDYWLNSLLTAIREHDPQFNPQLEGRWREAMGQIIGHFSRKY